MVQFGAQQTRQSRMGNKCNKLKRANPIVLVFLATPLFLLICVLIASHSISSSTRNLAMLRHRRATKLRTDLIYKNEPNGDINKKGTQALWDLLIDEAEALAKDAPQNGIHVMEVGMHRPKECLRAANHGLNAHCIEPSPISNSRILLGFDKATDAHKSGIRFYKAAAGEETGKFVKFQSGGTQGDHVGEFMDMWTMTKKEPEQHGKAWLASKIEPFLVKTVSVDDIIDNKVKPTVDYSEGKKVDKMFLVKIDTQGYEPEVLKGMKKSISEHKIDFIITEYWPKGMDFMHNATDEERCDISSGILKSLSDSGYILFAMPITHHPNAPKAGKEYVRPKYGYRVNFDDFKEHCEFFYKVEEKYPSEDYKMGYWTDILAVSPEARLPEEPKTELGRLVQAVINPSVLF